VEENAAREFNVQRWDTEAKKKTKIINPHKGPRIASSMARVFEKTDKGLSELVREGGGDGLLSFARS